VSFVGGRNLLNFCGGIVVGENGLVYLVEDWKVMEDYGTEEQRIYQIIAEEKKTVIRVVAGEIGFQKEFNNPKDPLIKHIKEFCEDQHFVKLDKRTKVDTFFK
jgi:hypothetical protein